jgi:hypothetical protein
MPKGVKRFSDGFMVYQIDFAACCSQVIPLGCNMLQAPASSFRTMLYG